jgi:glycosyltransferase involved in cell wall biosynthesis
LGDFFKNMDMKKLLVILNYYFPYVSGISEYARILCEELTKTGFEVTVLTANHNKLPPEEIVNGVRVIRAPIIAKISKGTVSPQFIRLAYKLSKKADVVNMHLPMLESGIISSFIERDKLIATYQCDIHLPANVFNALIAGAMDKSNYACLKKAKRIMATSIDYADNSRVAAHFHEKLVEAGAPVKNYHNVPTAAYPKKRIGFCGRIVEEKGIDILLEAYRELSSKRNDISLIIAGNYSSVAGGGVFQKLKKYIEDCKLPDVEFAGEIKEHDMDRFYSSLDVFVLPSVNSMEAFGMVQIEAMRCGTPVVASDLPGVRTVIQKTGMGLVCRKRDWRHLAECIERLLNDPDAFKKPLAVVERFFSTRATVEMYRQIFEE